MSTARVLVRNIFSNWVGFAVSVAVTFFLTPFVLHQLGDARYGVWALVMSITGYYGLLDLGFRAGLTQYITRYLATEDYDPMNRSASSGFVALLCCGTLIAVVSVVLAFFAPQMFTLEAEVVNEVFWCILIVGVSTAIQFAFFPFSAVFTATQRFDIANAIGILTRLATAAGTYAMLKSGYGLVGLSLVNAAGNLIDYGLRWRIAYRILPQLHVTISSADWQSCREFIAYGFWALMVKGGQQMMASANIIIVAFFMPAMAIARFALAVNLVAYFSKIFVPVGQVLFPAATRLDARGDTEQLKRLYLTGSRMLYLLAICVGCLSAVFSKSFYRLWVGEEYLTNQPYHSVALLYTVLAIGAIITAGQRAGYQVLQAQLKLRLLAQLFALQGVVSVSLSAILVGRFGLLGVAIGTSLSSVIFQGILHPVVICRELEIRLRTYIRAVLIRPFALLFALGVPGTTIMQLTTSAASSWPQFLLLGTLSFAAGLAVTVAVGCSRTERAALTRWLQSRVGRARQLTT